MAFEKYNSIDNHYNGKVISYWLEKFPELADEIFIVQEKLHGANCSVEFTPEGEVHLGKRSSRVPPHASFFDIHGAWARLQENFNFDVVRREAQISGRSFMFYGELFGGNVQKGVDYGPVQRIRFFDLRIEGKFVSQAEFFAWLKAFGLDGTEVPTLGFATSMKQALEFPDTFDSTILGKRNNKAEGVVIKPWHRFYHLDGRPLYLKKKSKAFLEKKSAKKPKLDCKISEKAAMLKAEFVSYITPQRLDNVCSKLGPIESPKQIGQYIKALVVDAKEDFLKENEVEGLNDKEQRHVFNVGANAAKLVKKRLEE